MRAGCWLAATLVATLAVPALAEDFEYTMNTGQLPGTEFVAADVVRQPAFSGARDEQFQAMEQAKSKLDEDYCKGRDGEFVVNGSLVIYDDTSGVWMIGGTCR